MTAPNPPRPLLSPTGESSTEAAMMTSRTISVLVPAYNAGATIERTIASALDQSHRDIEILVVDDGSTDDTADRVHAVAARESRVRLLRQPNGGVARARNTAIAAAQGIWVAPLDSDDLWHPEKLAMQLAALDAAPAGTALCYNWFRRIDADDRVFPGAPSPVVEGRVFHRHLEWNFISNGSTPLVRADIARAIGYESVLGDSGNAGVEDYLFQLRIARDYDFVCVPAYLTGYRRAGGGLSAQVAQMIRSHLQMYTLLAPTAGEAAQPVIARQVARLHVEHARNRLRRRLPGAAMAAFAKAFATDPVAAARALGTEGQATLRRLRRDRPSPPSSRFDDYAAAEPDGPWQSGRSPERLQWLASLDFATARQPAG